MAPEGSAAAVMNDHLTRQAIRRMVAAVEHIRDCERCRRVYDASLAESDKVSVLPRPFMVLDQCLRELRGCERWPNGI